MRFALVDKDIEVEESPAPLDHRRSRLVITLRSPWDEPSVVRGGEKRARDLIGAHLEVSIERDALACPHCGLEVSGPAVVSDGHAFHGNCLHAFTAAQAGLEHVCPQCSGSGYVQGKPTAWRPGQRGDADYDDWAESGGGGPGDHTYILTPIEWSHDKCPLCDGHGYLAKPPRRVEKFIGWERG